MQQTSAWLGSIEKVCSASPLHSDICMKKHRLAHKSTGGTVRFPSAYVGDQMLWQVSYIIHTAESEQTLGLLLNGEEKRFLLYSLNFSGLVACY
jgi:hypothetical protein